MYILSKMQKTKKKKKKKTSFNKLKSSEKRVLLPIECNLDTLQKNVKADLINFTKLNC